MGPGNREVFNSLPLKPPDRIPIRAVAQPTLRTHLLGPQHWTRAVTANQRWGRGRRHRCCRTKHYSVFLNKQTKELQMNPGSGCLLVSCRVNHGGRGCVVVDFFWTNYRDRSWYFSCWGIFLSPVNHVVSSRLEPSKRLWWGGGDSHLPIKTY